MSRSTFCWVAKFAVILGLIVVILGAYTRLSDAGLGCPDWPGCYGHMVMPSNHQALTQAQQAFPNVPIEQPKAWKEMIHRYFAGALGLLILFMAIWATKRRKQDSLQPVGLPWFTFLFIILQAAFGMWTVTLKLLPVIVTAHLLGGMTMMCLLFLMVLGSRKERHTGDPQIKSARFWAFLGLIILAGQIFLGAWTSTNYAALACPHFPGCHGTLFPHMTWGAAFNLFSPIGPNYEGGVLNMAARVTIQMAHRYGAFITSLYLLIFTITIFAKNSMRSLRSNAGWILFFLICQVTLGILNVVLLLPMWTAVLHNGVAALLLLSVVGAIYKTFHTK